MADAGEAMQGGAVKTKNAEHFWGRRGGGYVDEAISATRFLSVIAEARRKGIAAGTWPEHSTREWRQRAEAAARRLADGFGLSPMEQHALELFTEVGT